MRARIRTTGPNLGEPHRTETVAEARARAGRVAANTASGSTRALQPRIVKNFVLKRCTSRIIYVNNL